MDQGKRNIICSQLIAVIIYRIKNRLRMVWDSRGILNKFKQHRLV